MDLDEFMITLTKSALKQTKQIVIDDKLESSILRLKVVGGGCAGFQYDLYFEDAEPTPFDEVFETDDVKLLVDPLSLQYVDGVEIDYIKEEFMEGFKINNPNVTATCGCGSSFK
jgi:iron-sulfur cluster insertion protein